MCYVTSEGRVRLPDRTRIFLGIEQGGGVFFLPEKKTGTVRMLTNPQYLTLLEPADAPESRSETSDADDDATSSS